MKATAGRPGLTQQVSSMDFHEDIENVHTLAVSTEDGERIFVLTVDGWRCYAMHSSLDGGS